MSPGEKLFSMMIRRDLIIWGGSAKDVCFYYVSLLIENRQEVVTIVVTLPRMAKFLFIVITSR